jgi:hypothetical protein
MRITQAISRQQEFRSDELACHIAGSQALIGGLEKIRMCQPVLNSYWNSVVLPVALNGYQPALADGFGRFMQAPQVARATEEYLKQQSTVLKPSPLDTHPPLAKRIERAQRLNLPVPGAGRAGEDASGSTTSLPMISVFDGLPGLEAAMLKKYVPALAGKELKPVNWESTGAEVYVPMWRTNVTPYQSAFAGKTLADLPALVKDPKPVALLVPVPAKGPFDYKQRVERAADILFIALALSLIDHGWAVRSQPGVMYFEHDGKKMEPGKTIGELKSGKLTAEGWASLRAENGIGDWALASEDALLPAQ